jgi:transcriptional regulator with GAF, ATPase, and Fis domain
LRTRGRKRQASYVSASWTRPRRDDTSTDRAEADPLDALDDVIRRHVQRVIARSVTFTVAAERLGIDLATLWRMRKRWGLD